MLSILVLIHVGSGALALCAGSAALFVRKGYPLHRRAGNVFFVSMLIMAALGTYGAWNKPEAISVLNGLLTCHLVMPGWAIVRRKPGELRQIDFVLGALMVLDTYRGWKPLLPLTFLHRERSRSTW